MSRPVVIGLAGPARAGKDTVRDIIISNIGGYRYSFADPLRAMLAAIGVDMSDPYWIKNKETPIPALGNRSPRYLLQTLGTEWGRNLVTPDIWLSLATNHLRLTGPGMIIADVRFGNEAEWVRKLGQLVHVRRSDLPVISEYAHESETGILPLENELVIYNTGTISELERKIKDWLHVA